MEKTNRIELVGTLARVDLETRYSDKMKQKYIRGEISIALTQNGRELLVPVMLSTNEFKKDGTANPFYESYSKLEDCIGKRYSVSGTLTENRFWSIKKGQLMSTNRIKGGTITLADSTMPDVARYSISGFLVSSLVEKKNKAGEIYAYEIAIAQANYNDTMAEVIRLNVEVNENDIVKGVNTYDVGATVALEGDIVAYVDEKVVETPSAFGSAIVKTYRNKIINFPIKRGSAPITEEGRVYTNELRTMLIQAYKENDVKIVENAKSRDSAKESTMSVMDAPAAEEKAPVVTKRQTSLL